ncbi:CG15220 [Drosophila busckii]|uniref:CG15220 n=1 Tax=Drosophila busckii TaxID=30019 RepID=A0A0M4EU38_DROBS|nr:replication protein A 14 kDa subunit [Drosophila busckii]ALC41137.1 CG15220 [Drosophila busckii]
MNTPFEPRTLVNGGMIKQFAGQSVSIMVRVESVAGTTLLGNSTDNQKLKISLPNEICAVPGAWVEVIGIASPNEGIRAKEVVEFGGEDIDFDTDSYNTMTQLLNNVKQFYRYG